MQPQWQVDHIDTHKPGVDRKKDEKSHFFEKKTIFFKKWVFLKSDLFHFLFSQILGLWVPMQPPHHCGCMGTHHGGVQLVLGASGPI